LATDAIKALEMYNGVLLDGQPMKITLYDSVINPIASPRPKRAVMTVPTIAVDVSRKTSTVNRTPAAKNIQGQKFYPPPSGSSGRPLAESELCVVFDRVLGLVRNSKNGVWTSRWVVRLVVGRGGGKISYYN
jgi:hypothetical protein